MADDLDELLDEVEAKFCRGISPPPGQGVKAKQATGGVRSRCSKVNATNELKDEDDLDAMLEELLEDDVVERKLTPPNIDKAPSSGRQELATGLGTRKCCPVFLGGSTLQPGIGTSCFQRGCDRLRCISCDFRVISFDDQEWDTSCDYLFLRNNMPDRPRLQRKLIGCLGMRAYACQCSWHSASLLTDLRDLPRLKWVCGTHQT